MRRSLCLCLFLVGLLLTGGGCGASADAPAPEITPQQREEISKKAKEQEEQGRENALKNAKKPGG